jgi:cytochrome c peroxidase
MSKAWAHALVIGLVACGSAYDAAREDADVDSKTRIESSITSDGLAATDPQAPPPLKSVTIPEPPNLGDFVKDRAAAIALGKALFWDMRVGSDGKTGCATCHFHAGADSRSRNQVSPGLLRVDATGAPRPDTAFDLFAVNQTLSATDFPLLRLTNPDDRSSSLLRTTNDVVSSQGVAYVTFLDVAPGTATDVVATAIDPDGFRLGSANTRRVEPRNTPSVINAVFNHRNFWDGRAANEFNGVDALGDRNPNAVIYKSTNPVQMEAVHVRLTNASLASQAVAPPLSSFEMSADGRAFIEIGDKLSTSGKGVHGVGRGMKLPRKTAKKLLLAPPLASQVVKKDDSVLGALAREPLPGLSTTYDAMIRAAFHDAWWKSARVIVVAADGSRKVANKPDRDLSTDEYTQIEWNFSLFFGLAIQLYEATLVSDDTPLDRYAAGNASALSPLEKQGLAIFASPTRGRCINCHFGPELTDASVARVSASALRRRDGNLLDRGFNNIGVRATLEDLGVGGADATPSAKPLSLARLAVAGTFFDPSQSPPVAPTETLGVDGAFKTPSLRNVALTAPYFHDGGKLTLRQVVDFYSRGGDVWPVVDRAGNTLAPLHVLSLSDAEKTALVAFLNALTDDRVKYRRAPFDHPQLFVPEGHTVDATGAVVDAMREIPPVGKNGGTALPCFLE